MIVFLTLTTAGSDTGPFNLYSNLDGYIIPFETGIDKSTLELGYSTEVPDNTSIVRIISIGDCVNSVDVTLRLGDCELAGYVEEITTTTTTTAAPVITTVTEINIWFDNSGSMDSTLPPLEYMRDFLLKDCIGPIYGYDPLVPGSDAVYNERVKVNNFSTANKVERFVALLATPRNFGRTADLTVNQVLNLTFADESDFYGFGNGINPNTFNNAEIYPQYATDVATLRTNVAANPGVIKGVAFQVNTGPGAYPSFRGLTQATFVDTGIYTPNANISNVVGFTYELDVTAGVPITTTPAAQQAPYYLTKIADGLTTLGFTVNCSTTTTTTTI